MRLMRLLFDKPLIKINVIILDVNMKNIFNILFIQQRLV